MVRGVVVLGVSKGEENIFPLDPPSITERSAGAAIATGGDCTPFSASLLPVCPLLPLPAVKIANPEDSLPSSPRLLELFKEGSLVVGSDGGCPRLS